MPKINIKKHLVTLGIKKLKPKQKEIINLILKKKDIVGILPTGYGKSICYILPYLLKPKNVIVISPLISLMKDQYDKLKSKNIPTLIFNSSFSKLRDTSAGQSKYSAILKGKKSYLMYFSPESFMKNSFLFNELVKLDLVSLIAIDECHCVSSWAEFRSDYKELHIISEVKKKYNKKISTLALTATATIDTRYKILDILKLDKPYLVKESSYKDNLELFVKKKEGIKYDPDNIYRIINENGSKKKCIIYCKTKSDCEKLSEKLKNKGILCDYYHAGLNIAVRNDIQNNFKLNNINVITATIAFGMGIDIPDIHLIIHYGISKNIESYYQEIGRGGRDGKKVKCYVFWGLRDFITNKYFISKIENNEFKKSEYCKLNELNNYINCNYCRMKFICKYFDDRIDDCKKCDNCLIKIKRQEILDNRTLNFKISQKSINSDQTIDNMLSLIERNKILNDVSVVNKFDMDNGNKNPICVYDVSSNKCLKEDIIVFRYFVLKLFNNIGKGLGMSNIVKILKGKNKEYKDCSVYGVMKKYKNEDIKNYIRKVNHSEFITIKQIPNSIATYYSINEFGKNWFKFNNSIIINSINKIKLVQSKYKKYLKNKLTNKLQKSNIYKKLIEWRKNKATEINKPVYCVINNKTIENIVLNHPKNNKELLKIKGIGPKKIELYSKSIFDILLSK
tara:strand:- start:1302 stop:3335 length:2034 start_codon:yes stop_codon:yes gene_type:complete